MPMPIVELKIDEITVWDVTREEPKFLVSRFVGLVRVNIIKCRLELVLFYLFPEKDYIKDFHRLLYRTTSIELHHTTFGPPDSYKERNCLFWLDQCSLVECVEKDGAAHAVFEGVLDPPFGINYKKGAGK